MKEVSRDGAWTLLAEYVASESLRKHCLAVEAGMRAYARLFGEDEERWGAIGLLHDFDYEKYPEVNSSAKTGHPFEGSRVLRERGYPEDIIQTILSHASYSGAPRDTNAAKCLFALDELSGFVMAVAYMRPDRFRTMDAGSVEKKLKAKGFAAKVSREDIEEGIKELGIPREEHITRVIEAMRGISEMLFPAENTTDHLKA